MIASAFNDTSIVQFENTMMCEPTIPLTFSWSDLRITEIGFDGNDERIELTNIWDMDFSWTITVSWVKSSPVSYHIELPSTLSIIFWDTLSSLTGMISIITGQGFSLPDTTWFSITLAIDSQPIQQYSFSKLTISQIPNTFWLEAIRSGSDLYWTQTTETTIFNTIPPVVANPWALFCTPPIIETLEDPIDTWYEQLPDEFSWDIFTWDWNLSWDFVELSWNIETLDTWDIVPELQDPPIDENPVLETPHIPDILPCVISEIHPTTDTYPEYIELLCSTPFSGIIKTMGIGVWETNKDISISTNGWYWIVSSSTGVASSFNTTLITSMSLRDGWETITLSLSGFYTGFVTFPEIPSGKSFYPLCWTSGCIGLSSPGFDEKYLSGFVVWPISFPSHPTTTTSSSTSTYYQDLYNKRKSTAESYKTENSTLKKEQTRITKELTTLQKKTATTDTKKTIVTTTKAATIKSTTPKTQVKAPTKSTTQAKTATTTKKTPTVSTTSKAYIKLVDEHKLYKNYISFVDSYLKSRLYTQYSTLWLSKIQSLLANSLKAISKQNYILSLSWSTTWISVFDFNEQLWQKSLTLDTLYISLFYHYSSFFSSISNSVSGIFLAKDVSKDKLIEWKNLSKNDTWNDIMGTKISEMSFLHLE